MIDRQVGWCKVMVLPLATVPEQSRAEPVISSYYSFASLISSHFFYLL
jgi:hypothetical protein